MSEREKGRPAESSEERTVVKGLSFNGVVQDGNTVQVDIKDGKIIRIRPFHFDWKYDRKPWRIEARGKTFECAMKVLIPPYTLGYKNRVNSPNRVMYPLKRVDWDPKGERNPQNRGKSRYVRISWDEATDLVASEIRRIEKEYGLSAVLLQQDGHGEGKVVHTTHGCNRKMMSLLVNYTVQNRNPDSWEGWYWGAKHVWGNEPVGKAFYSSNIIPDIAEHTQTILHWGNDPETTPWGWGGQTVSQLLYWFTELGIKQICIGPEVNWGTAVHADKWIPIRPNTDAALFFAIAYQWITEGTYDKEYVDTHVVGFDKFSDYVLGKEDGIPKTPKWAEEKTTVPSRITKALARRWAGAPTVITHGNGGNMSRAPYATENMRAEVCLLGMQGVGKPGRHMLTTIEWGLMGVRVGNKFPFGHSVPVPRHLVYPDLISTEANRAAPTVGDLPAQFIPKDLIHVAINEATPEKPITWYGTTQSRQLTEDQFKRYQYPVEGCSEVHMIWTDTPCWITCWNDSNSYIKALRSPKIEFIMAQHPWMENDCLFADVILPVSTKFELDDIGVDFYSGNFTTLFHERSSIGHRGESKSDYEIVCMIAEKLGLLKEYTEGKTVEEWIKTGFDHSNVQNMITFEEFKDKGHYVVPTDPEWKKYPPGLRKFYEDPENNKLTTPTGKIEFYSQRLADHFPDDKERPPVPHWIEKSESHDERVNSKRAQEYPLLVVSNHPKWRVHANHDDMTWLREIPTCKVKGPDGYLYEPLWINPLDAAKREIQSGDVVKVLNERGAVLGGAYVTERIMAGAVYMDHGARYDPIIPGELDRGGAINTITPHNLTSKNSTGMVVSGFLVQAERANLDELRQKYPEAFKRKYHSGAGLVLERVLDGDK
jgi:molybdopterin guanine dinucleotide-containing S/N-oxide reductase-like protein